MTIDEASRLHLYEKARSSWGSDAADTLMNAIPADPDRFATHDDVRLLRADMTTLSAELRGEMAELRAELRGEMAELRADMTTLGAELRGEMAELRADMTTLGAELRGEMAELGGNLRTEMHELSATTIRTIVLAMVVSNATLVGLVFAAIRIA